MLREDYPTARRIDILERLPRRSWSSIRGQANKLKLIRRTRREYLPEIPEDVSLNDITFMHEHGLTLDLESVLTRVYGGRLPHRSLRVHTQLCIVKIVRTSCKN